MATERRPQRPTSLKTGRGTEQARKYSPLLAAVAALTLAILVLPSALNLPQSNPSTVLEYAPIPPDDESPPPAGALSSLGLGSSGGSSGGSLAGVPQSNVQFNKGSSLRPQTKRCVGKPPRQTEDPMSPPCVPYFEGDNGGATWPGVTQDEIAVLAYWDGGSNRIYITTGEGRAESSPPAGSYCDIDDPPGNCQGRENTGTEDHVIARVFRGLSTYFNDRFQTYNRRAHFYIYWSSATSEIGRRADAADNFNTIKPFAVMDQATFAGFNDSYRDAMAQRQVTMFSSEFGVMGEQLRAWAPQAWNFWPDVEHWADMYVSYVCTKVAPFQITSRHSGNSGYVGQMPKFGIMRTSDQAHPELIFFSKIVKQGLTDCGVKWETEVTFPLAGYATDTGGDRSYAVRNVAQLRDAGVNTVLWLGGIESRTTEAAAQVQYLPRWVAMGDGDLDGFAGARAQQQDVWRYATVVSPALRQEELEKAPGFRAYREGNPNSTRGEASWGNGLYRDFFMLFTAIQVAGPELSPWTIDSGFHAIPRSRSTSPFVGSVYFDPDDYSAIKDAKEGWWDPTGVPPGQSSPEGCYRLVREGRRFPAWTWEGGDDVAINRNDPCDAFSSGARSVIRT